jgi:hypothetical protein
VKSISSSDFIVFLQSSAEVAAAIALVVERVLDVIQGVYELRELKQRMEAAQVDPNLVQGMDDEINSRIDSQLEEIVTEVVDEFIEERPDGSRQEHTTRVTHSVRAIAGRLDNNFEIEVTTTLPDQAPAAEDGVESAAPPAEPDKYQKMVVSSSQKVRSIRMRGGAPVLELSEPSPANDEE